MNHTIEGSKNCVVNCAGWKEKDYKEKNREGYKVQEEKYNQRAGDFVNTIDVLDIQEIKVQDGLTDDKEKLEEIKKNFAKRLTKHAIELRAEKGIGKE